MSLGRIIRDIERQNHRTAVYGRIQAEAAARPESLQMQTPYGPVWMSPIEIKLYEALRQEGLDPVPQYYVQGYYADFAFPDVGLLVEADGAVHQGVAQHEHDRKRDWILVRQGWTVKRFHGTTITHRASNCAYVIKQEVHGRRLQAALRAQELARRRQARRDALMRPFRIVHRLLTRSRSGRAGSSPRLEVSPPQPPK